MTVKGNDQGYSWSDFDGCSALATLSFLPASSEVIAGVDPAFINGDDSLLRLQDLEVLYGCLLPLNPASLLVC